MDELRPKQKRFVKEYIKNGGNATQAVLDAKYKPNNKNTAGSIGSENLKKPKIQKALKSIADSIPDKLLIEKHLALLNAEKITRTLKRGEEIDVEEYIDNQSIGKGLDMAYKIKGTYAPEKKDITSDGEKVIPILVKFINAKE
jgi:phage terminase small subunit